MATQREILKRIKSVSSTKKITKTMEMVSTSKMKKMQTRLANTKPFVKKLENLISNVFDSGVPITDDSMFKTTKLVQNKLILTITGNRGLCGGYNTNVINNTLAFKDKILAEGDKKYLLQMIGKKGINYFKFINLPLYKSEANLEDKIRFNDAIRLGSDLLNLYKYGEVSEVYISYTKVLSSVTYKPSIYRLLPISIEEIQKEVPVEERGGLRTKFIFEPDPNILLASFLPLYITIKLYLNILESGFAEQNARRIAMKNATDAANDMVRSLTIKYNRARQAKITNEIAEIVGGAAALG
ncbi:MAG: ATP synthase F1 subunit gamma [Spirochaetota bacterium]